MKTMEQGQAIGKLLLQKETEMLGHINETDKIFFGNIEIYSVAGNQIGDKAFGYDQHDDPR